jgi:hypothetical protein
MVATSAGRNTETPMPVPARLSARVSDMATAAYLPMAQGRFKLTPDVGTSRRTERKWSISLNHLIDAGQD